MNSSLIHNQCLLVQCLLYIMLLCSLTDEQKRHGSSWQGMQGAGAARFPVTTYVSWRQLDLPG